MSSAPGSVHNRSPANEKIALFRTLFRGREDVYPRRFESRATGKSGYQPACGNEWQRGICEKPRVKCAVCPQRQFLPVTDDAIRWHLSGETDEGHAFVMGVYPMLQDETCFFLAADFDKAQWREDALAVRETCRRMQLDAALERSRSGNGGHVWLFFAEAMPAALARRLGAIILTETMERRPEIGLESYDRFFPNQDTLPQGGFGNLIALPLQKQPRLAGNSVFLDDAGEPIPDQWDYLSRLRKIERAAVEQLVQDAQRQGRVLGVRIASPDDDETGEPWGMTPSGRRPQPPLTGPPSGPPPEMVELVLSDQIYIAKETLTPALRNRLIRLAAFQNPEFYRAQSMHLPTFGKPRIIACAEDHPRHIALPRGCLDETLGLLKECGIASRIRDERFAGTPLDVHFQGELRDEQTAAVKALLKHDCGVLAATTAFGKTVVAAWMIAARGANALVLVHRRQLLDQWVERLSALLAMPAKQVGRIGGGRKKATGKLDVAIIQSLVRKGVVHECVADYGHIIVDECHHVSAGSFEQVVRRAKAKYVLGLSATTARKDGHHPIIFMQCGLIRHRVDAKGQAALRPFRHTVLVRPTGFQPLFAADPDARMQFRQLYEGLIVDDARNRLICADAKEAIAEGRSPLILTERNEHLDTLAELLAAEPCHVVVLRGGMGRKQRDAVAARLAAIPETEPRILLATGRYIGEGFDDPRLDTLLLTLPVSWRGTIAQYVGRLHRLHHAKREVRVYDYADLNVTMLARMFDRRCRGYEAVGYTILVPGSAVPGWPPEVPLPVDPAWKRDYAASVRRLVRDGVDAPLARLFVCAASAPDAAAEGVARARSASEAFLFRRLESLPETRGRFRLNEPLPIPFDGWGNMEVDFLWPQGRLAIELDGAQHLDSEDAYRRDRRKDHLLQEHGYLVLRFLAEDLGKRLDDVLDPILRAVARQAR